MNDKVFVTREGLKNLEKELNELRTKKRAEISERLHQALQEGGELAENVEYEDAKNEQAFVEGRILALEMMISNAVLIEAKDGPGDVVRLGSTVTVREESGYATEAYTVVGVAEASPAKGLISNESPLGKALLGRRLHDEVKVTAPAGVLSFKVVAIE